MILVWFFLYVLAGMGFAYWIFRDGEFRPIDTGLFMIGSVILWPFIAPTWLIVRPPSQLKDLTWEKSYSHFKHWKRTHKTRDIGDISYLDKRKSTDNSTRKAELEDVSGATSPDRPYVIGSSGRSNSKEFFPGGISEDDYGWEDVDDRALTYEIGTSNPRKSYNPFKKDSLTPGKSHPDIVSENIRHKKDKDRKMSKKDDYPFDVPSIADILDESPSRAMSDGTRPFRDGNVRRLIDGGRLRDAYRVARRMLKVAQELGEEDRITAYKRYIREIENRLRAAQKKKET